MDFGDILESWEQETAKSAGKKAVKKLEKELEARKPPEPTKEAKPLTEPKARKPEVPRVGAGMEEWLRFYGMDGARSAARSPRPGKGAEARQREEASQKVDELSAWLRIHGVEDKDRERELSESPAVIPGHEAAERRRRLREKRPDAVLDLHGLTAEEAEQRLDAFFRSALSRALDKVLIVHGKGNHSEGEAVLKHLVQRYLESSPYAGERGHAEAHMGGSGATWVLLKKARR